MFTCPCGAMFFAREALALHRKSCEAYTPKPEPKKPEPLPDLYDSWNGMG